MAWKKSFRINHAVESGDLIGSLVDRGRQRIRKSDVFLLDLATDLGMPFGLRRLRTLWRRDGLPVVSLWEWTELRQRAAAWLLRHAEWHEQQARADRLLAQRLIREAAHDLAGKARAGAALAAAALGGTDASAEQMAFEFDQADDRPPMRLAA